MNISYDLIGNYTNFSLFVQLLLKVCFKHFFHWSLNRLYSQSSFNEVMSVHPFISTGPQGHWEDWAEFTHCISPALLLWKEGRKTHFEFRFELIYALSRMRRSIYGKRLCFLQRSEFCPCKQRHVAFPGLPQPTVCLFPAEPDGGGLGERLFIRPALLCGVSGSTNSAGV